MVSKLATPGSHLCKYLRISQGFHHPPLLPTVVTELPRTVQTFPTYQVALRHPEGQDVAPSVSIPHKLVQSDSLRLREMFHNYQLVTWSWLMDFFCLVFCILTDFLAYISILVVISLIFYVLKCDDFYLVNPHPLTFSRCAFDVASKVCTNQGHEDLLLSIFQALRFWLTSRWLIYSEVRRRTDMTSFFWMQKYNRSGITWGNFSLLHRVDVAHTLKATWTQTLLYLWPVDLRLSCLWLVSAGIEGMRNHTHLTVLFQGYFGHLGPLATPN